MLYSSISEELGSKSVIAVSLNNLGEVAQKQKKYEEAVQRIGAAFAIFERIGSHCQEAARRTLIQLQDQAGKAYFETLLEEAQAAQKRLLVKF